MNPKVDFHFNKAEKWQAELAILRKIVLDCGLTEDLKWGVPCYTFGQNNVVLLHVFKEYCTVLFVKGVLLQDANDLLVQQTENTQSARQIRFTSVREITEVTAVLKAYIFEACEVEKLGLTVAFKKTAEYTLPEEFQHKLDQNSALKTAFDALTPGRQRAYLLYFSAPKQAKTREARIEKCAPQILGGKGLTDV